MLSVRRSCILQHSFKSKSIPRQRSIHKDYTQPRKQKINYKLYKDGVKRRHFSEKSSSTNSGYGAIKIVGGLTIVLGGGMAGALYYASLHPDVREKLEYYVPISSSLLDQIAFIPKNNNNNHETIKKSEDDSPSLLRPIKPISDQKDVEVSVVPGPKNDLDEEESKKEALVEMDTKKTGKKAVKEEPKKTKADDSVIMSAVDQPSVSSVDLAIPSVSLSSPKSTGIPDIQPDIKRTEQNEKATKETKGNVVVVSAVDVPGVSSVDLDIPTKPAAKAVSKPPKIGFPDEEKQAGLPAEKTDDEKVDEEHLEETIVLSVAPPTVDLTPLQDQLNKELEKLSSFCKTAIDQHSKAVDAIHQHSQCMKTLLATEQGQDWDKVWSECVSAGDSAEQAQKESSESALSAHKQVDYVQHLVKEIEQLGGEDVATNAAQLAAKVTYDIQTAAVNLQEAKASAEVAKEQQKLLDEGKEKLEKEFVEFVSRGDKEGAQEQKTLELIKSDAALVSFAQKRIEFLNQQLALRETEENDRLNQALIRQKDEDRKLTDMLVEQEKLKYEQEMEGRLKKLENEMSEQHENELRQQLRRQASALNDHLNDVLHVQAEELADKYQKEFADKLKEERENFEFKLRGALARLRGIESVIESRAEIDEMNRKAQELWLACKSLTSALSGSGLEHSDENKILRNEILAVSEAGAGSPLVQEILASIPPEATSFGVSTEENLRNRFRHVSQVCRRVATVDEKGGGLWTYALSYFQSFLIFNTFDSKKADELVDPEALNNYDVLSRAEYYVDIGDIEQAARYMNQLKGQSRRVAKDWINEARVLLETKQAAAFLTAYASACELGNLEK